MCHYGSFKCMTTPFAISLCYYGPLNGLANRFLCEIRVKKARLNKPFLTPNEAVGLTRHAVHNVPSLTDWWAYVQLTGQHSTLSVVALPMNSGGKSCRIEDRPFVVESQEPASSSDRTTGTLESRQGHPPLQTPYELQRNLRMTVKNSVEVTCVVSRTTDFITSSL